jgi:hypothetical protein
LRESILTARTSAASARRRHCSGGRPAARKEPTKLFDDIQISETTGSDERFIPPGATHRLYGRRDARRHGQEGKIRFGGAHFRRDIAAKVF